MEFAAYNDFDSDKESSKSKEKKLAVPLPQVEAPPEVTESTPSEGVIFESPHHRALTAPLFEHMLKTGEDDTSKKPETTEQDAEEDEADEEEATGKPKKGGKPAAPVAPTVPPHAEQSPSLQEEFSELLQEMTKAEHGDETSAESAEPSAAPLAEAKPEPPHEQSAPQPSAAERQPWHLPYTPLETTPATPPPQTGGGAGGRPPTPPRPPEGAAAFSPEPNEPAAAETTGATANEWSEAQPTWMARQQQRFNMLNNYGYGAATANTAPRPEQTAVDQTATSQAEYYAEKRGLRRGLVAGFITGYVLKQFLANRKMKRFQEATQKQFEKRDEHIDELTRRQRDYQERFAAQQGRMEELARRQAEQQVEQQAAQQQMPGHGQFEQPTPASAQPARFEQQVPAAATVPARFEQPAAQTPLQARFEQPAFAERPNGAPAPAGSPAAERLKPQTPEALREQLQANPNLSPEEAQRAVMEAYNLRPQQHIERSAWHNIVVDEKGHEVQGAMQYGEAFQRERQKEQVRAGAFDNGGQAGGGGIVTGGAYGAGYSAGANGQLDSGQVPSPYDLPAGQPDVQHRLQRPGSPMVRTLSSPWLWAGIVVLLVAFFIAALI